jgi:release factor glutamine methyltransferase
MNICRTDEAPSSTSFGRLRIEFSRSLLRPRPWTLAQSEWAADLLDVVPEGPVLELCTGAGHIGLAAVATNGRRLVAVDISPLAAEYAEGNADAAGLSARVEVRCGDLDEVVRAGEEFPLVIADPPWVRSAAVTEHPEDPVLAIDGGSDGLALARRCLGVAERHLAPGGSVLLQLGTMEQAAALERTCPDARLRMTEMRAFPGHGVLVRLDGPEAGS